MSLEDPRQRTRTYLVTYLDPDVYPAMGHIYYDNGSTEASYACMYAKPNIPLKLLYYGNKNYDVIFCIGEPDNVPTRDWQHKTYRYDERVPISICAVDKDGATAQLMLWQAELKLRKIVETYFSGSLRTLSRTKPAQQYLGGFFEYQVNCEINYTRSTDTAPTYPTLTYGNGGGAGTFTFPNVAKLERIPLSNNVRVPIPGRLGSETQKLGLPDYQINMTCDLDVEPTGVSWKRPQASTPKTDVENGQVFLDVYFNGQYVSAEAYQTLNLGHGAGIPVILDEPKHHYEGDRHYIDLTFYTYSAASQTAYKTFFGISP